MSVDDAKGARWDRRRVEVGVRMRACVGKARDGRVWKGRGGDIRNHLYAHAEGTEELDLVLRDELGKCDENARLECRLTVVVHMISVGSCEVGCRHVGSLGTYIKRLLSVMAHSSQLAANAIALEIVRVIVMNLRVSRAPQRRSR